MIIIWNILFDIILLKNYFLNIPNPETFQKNYRLLGQGNNLRRVKERQSLQGCQIDKNAAETLMASFDIQSNLGTTTTLGTPK